MLNTVKLKLYVKAVTIKMERGEELDSILATYTKLKAEEKEQIKKEINGEE